MSSALFDAEIQCLIVPGLNNSGPRHWQTLWEQTRTDCHRVDLGGVVKSASQPLGNQARS